MNADQGHRFTRRTPRSDVVQELPRSLTTQITYPPNPDMPGLPAFSDVIGSREDKVRNRRAGLFLFQNSPLYVQFMRHELSCPKCHNCLSGDGFG
jgi:hypothetical protein